MRPLTLLLLIVLLPSSAQCETNFLQWKGDRAKKIATWMSDGLVYSQIGLNVFQTARSEHRKHNLGCLALRNGVGLLANEVVKRVVHRERPNRVDNKSFYSMHTMEGATNRAWNKGWGITFTAGIALGRTGGGWHYASDVAVGEVAGELTGLLCRRQE